MEWEQKKLKNITIFAKADGKTTLSCGGKQKLVSLKKGENVEIVW
jgi:hypothetical protein